MKQTALAAALAVIGKESTALDSRADQVLRIVKQEKISDLKEWNAAVREAYRVNGWNGSPGKPKKGAEKKAVAPVTVKQYVSAIRGAFRLKLPVSSYSSFYALRQELKAKKSKARKRVEKAKPAEFAGLTVVRPDAYNGALFHDLAVLYEALDRARKPRMLSALERVKRDFSNAAPQLSVAVLPEMRKAA